MSYSARDRLPVIDLGFWPECFDVWPAQGLPGRVNATNTDAHFGMDGFWRYYLSPEATDGHALVDRGMVVPEWSRWITAIKTEGGNILFAGDKYRLMDGEKRVRVPIVEIKEDGK